MNQSILSICLNPNIRIQFIKTKLKQLLYYIIPPVILSLITTIVYYPSLNYPFQFDDLPNITRFYYVRHLNFESLFFSGPRWVSFWLNTINYKFAGFNPLLYRILNLSFHILTGVLIYFLILLLFSNLKKENFFKLNAQLIAFFTSLIFLLHPVQTQTVSYVVQGQMEGLSTLFILIILLIYYFIIKSKNKFVRIALIALMFFLGIFSTGTKEMAILSPFLIMLVDWFFLAQGNWNIYKKRIPLHLSFLAIIVSCYLYLLKPKFFAKFFGFKHVAKNNVGNILTNSPDELITPFKFFISQFKVILHYIFIFLWPFNISVEYDWKLAPSFFSAEVVAPLIFLIFIAILSIYLFAKNKINIFVFCIIWFFMAILPRSSIIPSSELLMDYKTYLASIGWILILAVGLISFIEFLAKKQFLKKNYLYSIAFVILTSALGILTYQRNKVWRSKLEFWENIIENAPNKARGFNNYGVELSDLGRHKEAIPYFKKAIKLEGDTYYDPYTNLANSYAVLGNVDLAIAAIEQSLSLYPYNPEAYNNLGTFLLHKKDFETAEKAFNAALVIRPYYGKAMYNYGKLHLVQENLEKAWQMFKNACTKSDLDSDLKCFQIYATTSMHLKKYEDAIFACKKYLELTRNSDEADEAMFNLGNAYYLNKDLSNAAKTFEVMIQQFPQDIRAWANLVETYIQMNQMQKALDLISTILKNGRTFTGLEIQKAIALAELGYFDLAEITIKNYLMQRPPEDLKKMALQILERIKS